jgi:N utilization substance protein B
LRVAIAEMIAFKGTPHPIIINEALEVGRKYAAPESITFLNGVLDAVSRAVMEQRFA